jgi:hypothetical protein
MSIIDEILSEPEFSVQPPVLIDIGASGKLHKKWKKIARYAICVAFDADEREFNISEKTKSGFKKLFLINSLIHTHTSDNIPFYLTSSPFCSSMLEPDMDSLEHWEFAEAFNTEKVVRTGAIDIADILRRIDLAYVDWFKSDSQGIDLRLFNRVTESIKRPPLAADFEPGIIKAYKGEDMLGDILTEMTGRDYWVSSLQVKGSKRIQRSLVSVFRHATLHGRLPLAIRNSPCWCELTYLHTFAGDSFERRDYLLGIVFSLIEKQHGFAFELAHRGNRLYGDELFKKIQKNLFRKIASRSLNVPIQLFRRAFYKYS